MTTCLIVDDVTVTRFTARCFIEELGLDVLEASDIASAKELLEKGGIDSILLDWHLKKKSGIELLEEIREEYGDKFKIIIFSGIESEAKKSEAISAGADGFISKPTTKEKIENEFKKVGII